MKLKKWGSLLTALAMVGSMATYVPASVSAAETDAVTYSGTLEFSPEVSFNITEYPQITLDNGATVDPENVLTIYATTDGATYDIPNTLIEDVAYEFLNIDTTLEGDYANALEATIDRIVISGNAVIDNAMTKDDAAKEDDNEAYEGVFVGASNTGEGVEIAVEVDCRATVETGESTSNTITSNPIANMDAGGIEFLGGASQTVVHAYEPNTTYKNHVCVNCNDVDTSFEAHDFTKTGGTVNTSKGTHTCKCGKTDADYLVLNADGSYMTEEQAEAITNDDKKAAAIASIGYYKTIHGFSEDVHQCGVCNAYDVIQHQGTNLDYTRTDTKHTIICADRCGYTKAAAAHTYSTYWNVNESELLNVAGMKIESGWHYCTVCGQVPGVTFDKDGNGTGDCTASHTYDSKFIYQWDEDVVNEDDTTGAYVKVIVSATTSAEKTVCKCGAVKSSHSHSYNNLNGHHLCYCGDEQDNHTFDYIYTITGDATVNGKKGWSNVGANKGAVCSCGNVGGSSDSDKVNHADGVDGKYAHVNDYATFVNIVDRSLMDKNTADDENGYQANTSFYTDTTTGKHYCTCGEEVVAEDADVTNGLEEGQAIHYYVNAKNEQHACICGKVNDNIHVYSDDAEESDAVVGYYVVAKNTASGTYQFIYVTDDTDLTNYKAVTCETAGTLEEGEELEYAPENGVFCKCGKLNPTHVCDFENKAMCIDGVHYCACGKASEEHDYDSKTNKCKICGEYVEHVHKPTSNTDCTCAVCGEPAHQLIKYGTTGHKCSICGEPVSEHVYVADTTAHTHTCEICGYVAKDSDNAHRFGTTGTAQCICTECGFEAHSRTTADNKETEDVVEKHYCTKCETDLSNEHVFNQMFIGTANNTDEVNGVKGYVDVAKDAEGYEDLVICACGEVKSGHVCEFAGNVAASDDAIINTVDRAGVTIKANDEYCVCGKVIAHKLGLATDLMQVNSEDANASYHACVNTVDEDANNDGTISDEEKDPCTNPAVKHNFPASVVSGKTVYATFCTGCGAVNPEKLNRARFVADILNAPTTTESEDDYVKLCVEQHNTYISTYTTSYIVSLTKDTKAVLAYDTVNTGATVTEEEDGTFTYDVDFNDADSVSDAITNGGLEFYSAPADVAKIKIAATTAEQTAFNTLLKTFNTTDAAASKNLAGGYITIDYIANTAVATAVGETGADVEKLDATTIYGKVGSEVDVKMLVKEGYKFSGWYSDAKATKLISADQITSVAVDNGETVIYALIEKNETKMIDIPSGVTYWSTVTQPVSVGKVTLDYDQTVKFCVGETVYMQATNVGNFVSFNNKNGNAFVYNYDLDEDGTIEATNEDCYAFTVRYADTYTMKTSPTVDDGQVYVIFKNSSNDRTLSQGKTNRMSAAAFEPDAPAQAGKTFVGWKNIADPTNTIVRTKAIDSSYANSTLTLVPLFKNRTDLKLTLENGSFLDAAQEAQNATGFEYGTPVKITAPEKNTKTGKYFSGWYNGDELVYGTRTVAHIITDTVTLTAKYEGSSELKAETSYVLSSKRNETSTGEQVVLTASWNIVEDVTVLDTGYVFTLAGASADKLTLENVDGSNVQLKQTGLKAKYAVYNYNMNLKDSTGASAKTVTAKFYVNYIDANGIEQTIYTDAVTEAPLS